MPRSRRRSLLALFLALALALASLPFFPVQVLAAGSPDLVISQLYGGGGNSGAPYTNKYVELFNRGTSTVNLTGWSLQYASASGTSWTNRVNLSGSIPAGGYFLVQLAGGANGQPLPITPDLSNGGINPAAGSGKLALVRSTTALTGGCPTSDPNVVDFIGYGGADCGEGGTKVGTLSNTTAAFRAGNGCTDTDNNAADFSVAAPSPRNSASPANPCGTVAPSSPEGAGNATPSPVAPGEPVLLTVAVTPGANPTSTGLAVTADLSAIGGSAAQAFYNDGTHGDATAGDLLFTFQATVAAATPPGAKSLAATITDAEGRSATTTFGLTVQAVTPPANHDLVMSQMYGGGGNNNAQYTDKYIELFNRGTSPVSIDGWSLQYTAATGTAWGGGTNLVPLTGTIPPGGYFLVQLFSGTNGSPLPITPDLINAGMNPSATNGKLALVSSTTRLPAVACPLSEPTLVDLVGYGTANCGEGGAPAPGLTNTTTLFRKGDGCVDTNNNGADFLTGAPSPRNSASPLVDCFAPPTGVGNASPSAVTPGQSTLLTVATTLGPLSAGAQVTADLSQIGGSAAQAFYDDATNGDARSGDLTFSFRATLPASIGIGPKSLPVTITDNNGRSSSTSIDLTVQEAQPTPPSGTGSAAPALVAAGNLTLLTVDVTPGTIPTSTGLAVTADLSAIGGDPAQPLYDDATNGDTTAGDNRFAFRAEVASGAPTGTLSLPVTITDAEGRIGFTAIPVTILPPPEATAKLLIAELLIAPSGAGELEEFIKLYNPTDLPVDLSGWSLSTLTGTTVGRAAFPQGAQIGPHDYVVATLTGTSYQRQVDPHASAAKTFEYGPTASGFGIPMLRETTTSLALPSTNAVVTLRDPYGAEADVVRYAFCSTTQGTFTCATPTPYSGDGWAGPVITMPQTQGFTTRNKILARAIDESTITATSAGTYKPDTNTAADWLSSAINSATGLNYWQAPGSASATPLANRDYIVGQMQSLPIPTWAFDGTVTGFMAPDNAYDTIAALFEGATTSIDLNMYDFQLVDMAQVLASAARRGVSVRVLLEGQPCCDFFITDQTRYVAKLMHDAGAEVRYMASDSSENRFRRYDNVNHAKYAIVDGVKTMVFSGNFKKSSTSRNPASGNRDWGVIIPNAEVAAYFASIFAYDFDPLRTDTFAYGYTSSKLRLGAPSASFTPSLVTDGDPGGYYLHPFSPRTVTGAFKVTPVMVPETDFQNSAGLLGMLKGAQSEILLEWATVNPYWGASVPNQGQANTPMPLVQELINAARRGVKVRVLLDGKYDTSSDPDAKANSATVQLLNQIAQAEGLDMVARIMPFTVISGSVDSDDYLVREFPGYNEIHNKGIIVDGSQVLISSINGTQASWLRNREAAVIVENGELGEYFGDAFWYDWYDGTAPAWPVITEVQYDGAQWVELYNPTGTPIDLTGWRLANRDGEWAFPAGATLGAGATLTIAQSAIEFHAQFGFAPDLDGETLLLAATGDTLRLLRPDGSTVDRVAWENFAPDWGIGASAGQSLVRMNGCKDTNSRVDWEAAAPQPGMTNCNGALIDAVPPTIQGSVDRAPNANGWYNADVVVTFTCSDAGSGIATCPDPVTLSTEGIDLGVTGTATDRAGNTASVTVSGIKIDRTAPEITWSGNQGSYAVDQMVEITCTASDALSGVATTTCEPISGAAYTFAVGMNSFSATAVDLAGNEGSGSVSLTVGVSFDSLANLIKQLVAKEGIANSLLAKLDSAKAAGERGNLKAKQNGLEAFAHEVDAQSGKAFTAEVGALLKRLAQGL